VSAAVVATWWMDKGTVGGGGYRHYRCEQPVRHLPGRHVQSVTFDPAEQQGNAGGLRYRRPAEAELEGMREAREDVLAERTFETTLPLWRAALECRSLRLNRPPNRVGPQRGSLPVLRVRPRYDPSCSQSHVLRHNDRVSLGGSRTSRQKETA
jgi:hypothetical protein